MMTTADLDAYVKTAAHDYISKSVPLNDTITKLANDHGFNREQINRVVEGANTEVYVQLFNQAKDKYIQFDNADSEKIASVVLADGPKTASIFGTDYESSPDPVIIEKTGSVFNVPADELRPSETDDLNTYHKLAALETQLENTLAEIDIKFQKESDTFYNLVKQAVLEGTPFGDVHKAVTSVYPQPLVDASLTVVQQKLAQEMPLRNFEKTSSQIGSVNKENPLIKQAELLVKYSQEYLTLRDKYKETTASLIEHVKQAGVFKALLKKPKTTATIAAAGLVGGVALDKHMNTIRQRDASSPLQSIPAHYIR